MSLNVKYYTSENKTRKYNYYHVTTTTRVIADNGTSKTVLIHSLPHAVTNCIHNMYVSN